MFIFVIIYNKRCYRTESL